LPSSQVGRHAAALIRLPYGACAAARLSRASGTLKLEQRGRENLEDASYNQKIGLSASSPASDTGVAIGPDQVEYQCEPSGCRSLLDVDVALPAQAALDRVQ